MAPSALLRAALRRRTPLPLPALSPPPQSATSSYPSPDPNPEARRHLITLNRRCPHPPSSAAASASSYTRGILFPLPTNLSPASPLSTDKESLPPPTSWVERWVPEAARPYAMLARLDKPIGTWLLAWPCMWSITTAAMPGELPDFKMLALFGCGAVLLRGAGCTVNDLLDRDIDKKAYLGLTFNWGALLGWAAIRESLDPAIILPLYTAGICWTLVYDTIYAHQDKEDDLKVGVKSTALRFGDSTKHWISGFGAACIGSLALSGYNADLAWPYYPFLTAAAAQLAWQISTVDLSDRPDCNRKFVSNKWFGALVFGGDLFGRLAS